MRFRISLVTVMVTAVVWLAASVWADSFSFSTGNPDGRLAALSRQAHFSVGCYCEDEARCHRSELRALLEERGADVR